MRWPHIVHDKIQCCDFPNGPVHGKYCLRFFKHIHIVGFGWSIFIWLPHFFVSRW